MKDYLESVLHKTVSLERYTVLKKLPLAYRRQFSLYLTQVNGQAFLLAVPAEDMNLSELRKNYAVLSRFTNYSVAFYLQKLSYYAKESLIQAGIPFVLEGKQLYLPFLGMLLDKSQSREIKPCSELSFLTQKLLLKALYENWQNVSVTQAAELLQVSKMSVTRCFDEIQSLKLPYLTTQKRSRKLSSNPNRKEMWEELLLYLRNPVTKTLWLGEPVTVALPLSGISALAEYSMLGEESYTTYAATKSKIRELGIGQMKQLPQTEVPVCAVQEVVYFLPFQDDKTIDPLSLILSLSDEDKNDPRVELVINEMLEEYVW